MVVAVFLATVLVALVLGRWLWACLEFRRAELAFDGEPSLPLLGNALAFVGVTEHDFTDLFLRLWGGRTQTTRISFLGHLLLVVSDPDGIEKVIKGKDTQDKSRIPYQFLEYFCKNSLVPLNGSQWKAHRKALAPAFHSVLLNKYQEFFDEEAKCFVGRVRPGEAQDVLPSLTTSAARAILRTALNTDSSRAELSLPIIMEFLHVASPTIISRNFQPWNWSDTLFGLTGHGRRVRDLVAKVDECVLTTMTAARSELARSEEDFVKERPTLTEILVKDSRLPDRHVMDEFIVFLGAAIETTSSALGWTLKTLSLRQDVQDRIVREVSEVIGQADAVLPEHLPRLEYTERVIKESLRLTPAVPVIARSNLHAPTTFDGKHVPKGTTFVINMYGAHRDPRHWEEPLKFDPDRWLPERSQGRHPYAFTAFSAGPRNCIGSRYAMAFMKTLLATVLPKYRVDPVDDGHTDPATFPMTFDVASRMPGGVHVVFTPRQPTPTATS